MAKKRKKLFL